MATPVLTDVEVWRRPPPVLTDVEVWGSPDVEREGDAVDITTAEVSSMGVHKTGAIGSSGEVVMWNSWGELA